MANSTIVRNNNNLHIGNGPEDKTNFIGQLRNIHNSTNDLEIVKLLDELRPPEGGGDWYTSPVDVGVFKDEMYGITDNHHLLRYNADGTIDRAIIFLPVGSVQTTTLFSLGFIDNAIDNRDVVLIGAKIQRDTHNSSFILCYTDLGNIIWDGDTSNPLTEWAMPIITSGEFNSEQGQYGYYAENFEWDQEIDWINPGHSQPFEGDGYLTGDHFTIPGWENRGTEFISPYVLGEDYISGWKGHFLDGTDPNFQINQIVQLPSSISDGSNYLLFQIEREDGSNYKWNEACIFRVEINAAIEDNIIILSPIEELIPYFVPIEYLASPHSFSNEMPLTCHKFYRDSLFWNDEAYGSNAYWTNREQYDWTVIQYFTGTNSAGGSINAQPFLGPDTDHYYSFSIHTLGTEISFPGSRAVGQVSVQDTVYNPAFDYQEPHVSGFHQVLALGYSSPQIGYSPTLNTYKIKFLENIEGQGMRSSRTEAFKDWSTGFTGANWNDSDDGDGFYPSNTMEGETFTLSASYQDISLSRHIFGAMDEVAEMQIDNTFSSGQGSVANNVLFRDYDHDHDSEDYASSGTTGIFNAQYISGTFGAHRSRLKSSFMHIDGSPPGWDFQLVGFNNGGDWPDMTDDVNYFNYMEPLHKFNAANTLPFVENFFMSYDDTRSGGTQVKYPKKAIQIIKADDTYKVMVGFSPGESTTLKKYLQLGLEIGHRLDIGATVDVNGRPEPQYYLWEEEAGSEVWPKLPITAEGLDNSITITSSDVLIAEVGELPNTIPLLNSEGSETGTPVSRCWGRKLVNDHLFYSISLSSPEKVYDLSLTHNPHLAKLINWNNFGNEVASTSLLQPLERTFGSNNYVETTASLTAMPEDTVSDLNVVPTYNYGAGGATASGTSGYELGDAEYYGDGGSNENLHISSNIFHNSLSDFTDQDTWNIVFTPSADALTANAQFSLTQLITPFNNEFTDNHTTHLDGGFINYYKDFLRIIFQSPEDNQLWYGETDSDSTIYVEEYVLDPQGQPTAIVDRTLTIQDSTRHTSTSTTGSDKLLLSVASASSTSGTEHFSGPYVIEYKASFVYDGYQESPLQGSGTTVTVATEDTVSQYNITVAFDPLTFNRRITHIGIYRKLTTDDQLGDTSFKLIEEIPIDPVSRFSVDSNGMRFIVVIDKNEPGASYESIVGISEALSTTTMNYGISSVGDSYLFVSDARPKAGLPGDYDNYIFRSMPGGRFSQFNWPVDHTRIPDKATALQAHNGRLYAFSESRMFTINPSTLELEDIFEGVGCYGPGAIISTEYGMCFADSNNIYLLENGVPKTISFPIASASAFSLPDGLRGWGDQTKSNIHVSFDGKRKSFLIFFTYETEINKELVNIYRCWAYNLPRQRWDLLSTKGPVTATHIALDKTVIYVAGGFLYKFLAGPTQKPWSWHSKDFVLTGATQDKKFRNLKINSDAAIDDASVSIKLDKAKTGSTLRQEDKTTGSIVQKTNKISSGSKKFKTAKVELNDIVKVEVDSIGIVYTAKKAK